MNTFVALFKGINVGGNKKVKMDDLKKVFDSIGMKDVTTYIQSGNVIFKTTKKDLKKFTGDIEKSFEKNFGFKSVVIIRSKEQLAKIASYCPITDYQNKNFSWIMVNFLSHIPSAADQKNLIESYNGPEEFYFHSEELFIYYPAGSGRSKLNTTFIEKKIKAVTTSRNWNTVLKLNELVGN